MTKFSIRFWVLLSFMMLVVVSCVPEDELDPDGSDPRDKFIGSWRFIESKAARGEEMSSYTVTISYDPSNSSQVLLRNFAQAGGSYSAYGIVTSMRITVPSQEMSSGFVVDGDGVMIDASTMNWEFSYTTGGDQEFITAVATK